MSEFTLVFSGPARTSGQAQNALSRAGYPTLDGDLATDPHGMPDMVDGSDPTEPQGFLVVQGDDVNGANDMAGNYGWALRACRVSVPQPESDPLEAKLMALEARVKALEAR